MKIIKEFSNGLQVAKNNGNWCITDGYQTDYLRFIDASCNWVRESDQLAINQDIKDYLNKWAFIHYSAYQSRNKGIV